MAGRLLVFSDRAERPILVDAGELGWVLTTLIENSLRYGGGTTRVWTHVGTSRRGIIIEVSGEDESIDESLASGISQEGVSDRGPAGIDLALAHDLAQAMSGRLELRTNKSPVFIVSIITIPASLDPDRVVPEGPLMSAGHRLWRS